MTAVAPDARVLPENAQLISSRIEDAMHLWQSRSSDPSRSLPFLRAAIDECGHMIEAFGRWRDDLHDVYVAESRRSDATNPSD